MQGVHGINGAELQKIPNINVDFGILSMAQRGNPWILMEISLFLPILHPSPIPGGASLGKKVTLEQFRTFLPPEFLDFPSSCWIWALFIWLILVCWDFSVLILFI